VGTSVSPVSVEATVAVNVTDCPENAGLGEDISLVAEGDWLTTWLNAGGGEVAGR
jgi:hypothetical protein